MGIFFTSDTHFGHVFMAEFRGFDSVNEHDEAIIANINKVVRPEDTLFILGDVAMGGWVQNAARVSRLNGTKHIVIGNHDRVFAGNRNPHSHLKMFLGVTGADSAMAMTTFRGMILSHFPYDDVDAAGDEGRHDEFRPRDAGRTIIHGHVHNTHKATRSAKGTLQIHVGLDAWGLKPVSLHQIETIVEEQNERSS